MKAGEDVCSFDWLNGSWINKSMRQPVYENWSHLGEINWRGVSFKINSQDTVVLEKMELRKRDDGYYFIPTVSDQNNNLQVLFKIDSCAEGYFRARNDTHDFPQVIIYKRILSDSLVAQISGNINGQNKSIFFPMKRQAK